MCRVSRCAAPTQALSPSGMEQLILCDMLLCICAQAWLYKSFSSLMALCSPSLCFFYIISINILLSVSGNISQHQKYLCVCVSVYRSVGRLNRIKSHMLRTKNIVSLSTDVWTLHVPVPLYYVTTKSLLLLFLLVLLFLLPGLLIINRVHRRVSCPHTQ